MANKAIKEHMKVLSSDGRRVGKVDCVDTNEIILAKSGHKSGGKHHAIPLAWVTSVGDEAVKLNQPQDIVFENWIDAEPRSKGSEPVC